MVVDVQDPIFPIALLIVVSCIVERATANVRHAIGDSNGGKAVAIIERATANVRHGVRNGDGGKVVTIVERRICNRLCARFDRKETGDGVFCFDQVVADIQHLIFPIAFCVVVSRIIERSTANGGHAVGDGNGGKIVATIECFRTDGCHTARNGDGGKTVASRESPLANGLHTILKHDGGETTAISKRSLTNGGHAIGDGDLGKTVALKERIFTNGRHAVSDRDGGKTAAPIERLIADGCHAVRDGDGGNVTPREYIRANGCHGQIMYSPRNHSGGKGRIRTTDNIIGGIVAEGIGDPAFRNGRSGRSARTVGVGPRIVRVGHARLVGVGRVAALVAGGDRKGTAERKQQRKQNGQNFFHQFSPETLFLQGCHANKKACLQPKTRPASGISDCCHTNFQLIGKRDTKMPVFVPMSCIQFV